MSILLNFAMFPIDASISKSEPVSKVLAMIKDSGLNYKLGPMGTTIETESMPEALEIINKAYSILEPEHDRVYSSITIDARKGKTNCMQSKIAAVESKIGVVNK